MKCKACGREIIWIKTKAGKNMPCDPESIRFKQGGKEKFVESSGWIMSGERADNGHYSGHISHFATCPEAEKFRRK